MTHVVIWKHFEKFSPRVVDSKPETSTLNQVEFYNLGERIVLMYEFNHFCLAPRFLSGVIFIQNRPFYHILFSELLLGLRFKFD